MITNDMPSSKATAEVRVHINNLNLTLKIHSLDGTDPLRVFDLLVRLVNKADILNMSEVQAFISYQHSWPNQQKRNSIQT